MNNSDNIPFGAMFHIIGKRFKMRIKYLCNERGINSTYAEIIMLLARNKKNLSQNEIADYLHLSAPTTSLTLKQMETEGIVSRIVDSKDSRKSLIKLTEKGLVLNKSIKSCFEIAEKELINGLDDNSIITLRNIFKQMNENFDKMEENPSA